MSRSVPEWIGKTNDSDPPQRVRVRLAEKYNGICPKCGRKLQPKKWNPDHIVALVNGGQNRETNLQPLCDVPCHSNKTKEDVAIKSKNYRVRAKSLGIDLKPSRKRLQSRGFQRAQPQRSATRPIERRE